MKEKTMRKKLATEIIRELAGQPLKIISHEDVEKFWKRDMPKNITFRYTEETVYEAIDANKRCGEKWTLAYYSGQSLRQIRAAIVRRNIQQNIDQPCFYP